jgi:hypothetical protein
MHYSLRLLAMIGFAAMLTDAQAAKIGLWQYDSSITMKMAGLDSMPQLPAGIPLPKGMTLSQGPDGAIKNTSQMCVTDTNPMPPMGDKQKCTWSDIKHDGDKVSWTATCDTPQGKMTGTGSAEYKDDTMTSATEMHGRLYGQDISMNLTTAGHYLSACPAAPAPAK